MVIGRWKSDLALCVCDRRCNALCEELHCRNKPIKSTMLWKIV